MNIIGSDGVIVGAVKELKQNDFLVDRPMAIDVHLPYSAIRSITGGLVALSRFEESREASPLWRTSYP